MKAEDVVAKHLDSIASAEKRAAIKSTIAVGEVSVNFVTQKSPPIPGRIVLASANDKLFYGMNLNSDTYPSEKFSFDGSKSKVAIVRGGTRTILGNFVSTNDLLLEESLLGGTLSTSWAILHLSDKKAKLSYNGTKKIDGKEAYAIGYSIKGGGDINVTLYFDKETFRHLRSEYRRISSAGIGTDPSQSSRFNETRMNLTEDFSDFKEENGITLPHTYRLNYSVSGQRGTTEIEWTSKLNEFAFNQNLSDSTFDAEAN
ncbi:MAG: hypothetical protein ACR2MD_18545 [Aridibacter sp.]